LTGPSRGQRPTLQDVARRSGVSRSTVSRVMNGSPRVSAEVATRIRDAVTELGYVPNQAARSLVTRRTNAVAVVVTEPQSRLFVDPFFDRHLRGVRQELVERKAQLVLLLIEEPDDYPRVGDFLAGRHVDGALLFSLRDDDPLPGMVARMGLPAVFGGRPVRGEAARNHPYSFVDADNRDGARQAVGHLVRQGRRRIASIAGPPNQGASNDRLDGYRDMLPAGAPELVARGDYTLQGGAAAMEELLDRCPGLDAVFVASDLMARGALGVLEGRGRAVPTDVAVVGFDDLESLTETEGPLLTTVHQDPEGMGRLMTRLLFEQMSGAATVDGVVDRSPRSVVMPTHLVLRETA
jgi:DNA-binding LacI/PurR family transcriptional regulator